MNILLDNIIFSLQHGGGASVVWTEHVKRIVNDVKFKSKFIEYNDAINNIFRKTLEIQDIDIIKKSSLGLFLKRYIDLSSMFKDPFIFHSSHYRIDNNPYAKNITTVHDFVYEKYVRGIRQKVHSFQKWHSIRKADAVICISESTKLDLLHYLPDVDENKIYVVHNGVNEGFKQISKDDYNLNLPFETGEFALYIGCRHVPYKNFKTVVELCRLMKMPLITVGGEPLEKEECKFLEERIGKNHYRCLRGTSNKDLNELYNRAFVLLYPSLYEGFGIPVIEAQRCGCPVFCMASSSIPEIVGNSNLCVPVNTDLGGICERLKELNKTGFRKNEIENGLMNSKRFSWDKTYKKTTEIYNILLGE